MCLTKRNPVRMKVSAVMSRYAFVNSNQEMLEAVQDGDTWSPAFSITDRLRQNGILKHNYRSFAQRANDSGLNVLHLFLQNLFVGLVSLHRSSLMLALSLVCLRLSTGCVASLSCPANVFCTPGPHGPHLPEKCLQSAWVNLKICPGCNGWVIHCKSSIRALLDLQP